MINKNIGKKKVLFLTKFKYKDSQITKSALHEYIKEQGHEVYYADPGEINIILKNESVNVFFNDIDISDVDIVISRNSRGVVEKVDQITKILKLKGAVVFGHEEETPFSYRKFGNHFKLLKHFPKTIYFTKNNKDEALKLIEKAEISMPFILKPEGSSRGVGVILVKDKKDYDAYFNSEQVKIFQDFIIQEYLDIKNEYRVFVLGKKSLGVCEKKGEGLIAKNLAQGSEFFYLRDENLESLAETLALELNHHTLGFDIVKTKNDELKLLEVNSWANFEGFGRASNINMPEKIFNYYLEFTELTKSYKN
ncbi:MAG TPA: hypothetical protein PKU93_00605 [Candidatus Pacearchaeota archaeon]|nr:hypothetical protein [Candidatus Pacearchaeota archaeon]